MKETLKGEKTDEIKAKLEETKTVAQELGVKIYEQAAAAQAEGGAETDSKIVDAEVVEESEDKKEDEKKEDKAEDKKEDKKEDKADKE